MAGRQTIPGAKAPVPKKKSAKAKAEAKEAKKAKKPSSPKGTGKIDIGALHFEGAYCGNTGCGVFKWRRVETKLLNFENWVNGEV